MKTLVQALNTIAIEQAFSRYNAGMARKHGRGPVFILGDKATISGQAMALAIVFDQDRDQVFSRLQEITKEYNKEMWRIQNSDGEIAVIKFSLLADEQELKVSPGRNL